MMMLNRAALRAAALTLAVAGLAGCASVGSGTASPEEAVKARATAFWNARVAGDFDGMYQLTPPSYRALNSAMKYRGSFGSSAQVTGAEVVGVTCTTEDRCVAKVKLQAVTFFASQRTPITTHYDETWVREEGQWWQFQGR